MYNYSFSNSLLATYQNYICSHMLGAQKLKRGAPNMPDLGGSEGAKQDTLKFCETGDPSLLLWQVRLITPPPPRKGFKQCIRHNWLTERMARTPLKRKKYKMAAALLVGYEGQRIFTMNLEKVSSSLIIISHKYSVLSMLASTHFSAPWYQYI